MLWMTKETNFNIKALKWNTSAPAPDPWVSILLKGEKMKSTEKSFHKLKESKKKTQCARRIEEILTPTKITLTYINQI